MNVRCQANARVVRRLYSIPHAIQPLVFRQADLQLAGCCGGKGGPLDLAVELLGIAGGEMAFGQYFSTGGEA